MTTGIEMMLKSMGVDPNAIKTALTTARDEVMNEVKKIHTRLDAIDAKLNAVLYPVKSSELPATEGGYLDYAENVPVGPSVDAQFLARLDEVIGGQDAGNNNRAS